MPRRCPLAAHTSRNTVQEDGRSAGARPVNAAGAWEMVRYGLAVVSKTSVRFVVLPEFACTNTGTNVFPIVASPS